VIWKRTQFPEHCLLPLWNFLRVALCSTSEKVTWPHQKVFNPLCYPQPDYRGPLQPKKREKVKARCFPFHKKDRQKTTQAQSSLMLGPARGWDAGKRPSLLCISVQQLRPGHPHLLPPRTLSMPTCSIQVNKLGKGKTYGHTPRVRNSNGTRHFSNVQPPCLKQEISLLPNTLIFYPTHWLKNSNWLIQRLVKAWKFNSH
jgi:hypothetical protein